VQPEGYPEDGQEQQPAAQGDTKDTRVHTISPGMAVKVAAARLRSAMAGAVSGSFSRLLRRFA